MKACKKIKYTLKGDPIPLARARISSAHKKMWDSQKEKKLICGITLRSQHQSRPLYQGPHLLKVTFFMPIPKTKRHLELENSPHFFRADLDNLIKWICDIGTGVLYKDDCIIAAINAKKIYGDPPRTEFTLTPL